MKYIDWSVQTLILGAGLIFFTIQLGQPDWPVAEIFITQLFLGPWQMLSSAISFIRRSNLWRYKRMHLLLASCYLILTYVFSQSTISVFENTKLPWILFLTLPSMGLAVFYYFITWKSTFITMTRRGSFLPNINF